MPTFTSKLNLPKPLGNEVVSRANHNALVDAIDAAAAAQSQVDQPFYLKSATYDGANNRIVLTFGPGRAAFLGVLVATTGDSTYYINSPAPNTSYYVSVKSDGTFTHNTTGAGIAGAVALWRVTTGATVDVLTTTDLRGQLPGAAARVVQDNLDAHRAAVVLDHPNGSVTTEKLAPGAVTADKLAPGAALPAGAIMPYAGAAEPAGWLFCDGRAVSRTTYADLFAAIGTTYGAGDGSTTFNLPNLKGRVPVGFDSAQVEFDALGEAGGSKTHTLTAAELPSHAHPIGGSTGNASNDHTHGVNITSGGESADHAHLIDPPNTVTDSQGAHAHNVRTTPASGSPQSPRKVMSEANWGGVGDIDIAGAALSAGAHQHNVDIPAFWSGGRSQGHTHNVSGNTGGQSQTHSHSLPANTGATGSGSAHPNLQPYLVLQYIIKV